jgi:NADPH:quinone reductase-like Zn-dependent oxidoreductase
VGNLSRVMRGIVYERYGPPEVLEVRELARPVPGPGEVLVDVSAAALNPKDSLVRKGRFRLVTGQRFPRRLGYDFAGVVHSLGPGVTGLAPGAPVFGMLNGWAGGTVAEQVCVPQRELARKPERLDFEQAAALPLAALTALQALRDEAQLQPGQRVLINGASGGVGVVAIQVARLLGARVTTTSSARNLELCRSLGAHEAWDYAAREAFAPGGGFDVIFDVFGNRSFSRARPALAARGTYVTTVPGAAAVALHLLTRWLPRRARLVVVRSNRADLEQLARAAGEGALVPVIDRVVPLEETAAGQAHVETRRARGKVVVRVRPAP